MKKSKDIEIVEVIEVVKNSNISQEEADNNKNSNNMEDIEMEKEIKAVEVTFENDKETEISEEKELIEVANVTQTNKKERKEKRRFKNNLIKEELSIVKKKRKKVTSQSGSLSMGKRSFLTIDKEDSLKRDNNEQKELEFLLQAAHAKTAISGLVKGVEFVGTKNTACFVTSYGDYKVIIPEHLFADFELVVKEQERLNKIVNKNAMYTKRIGGEIDFVIMDIDKNAKIASADRVFALEKRSKEWFFKEDKQTGDYIIYTGRNLEARIVTTNKKTVVVEVFGVETTVKLEELSYQLVSDARIDFKTGQRVPVKIIKLERDIKNKEIIALEVSIKQTKPDPKEKAFDKYELNGSYEGVVKRVDTTQEMGIYVSLEGIDVLCQYFSMPVETGDVVQVKIIRKDKEKRRLTGRIRHVRR